MRCPHCEEEITRYHATYLGEYTVLIDASGSARLTPQAWLQLVDHQPRELAFRSCPDCGATLPEDIHD